MRFWVFVIVVLLVNGSLLAQEDVTAYRLRVPTATEYLLVAPEILEQGNMEFEPPEYSEPFNRSLFDVMTEEIYYRYPELWQVDGDLLYDVYKTFYTQAHYWWNRDTWGKAIVLGWLNQHDVELNRTDHLDFYEFEVEVKPRDFNADGQMEWWLDVKSDVYSQYLVVAQDSGGYHLVETSLVWYGIGFAYYEQHSGAIQSLDFRDINADGLPEWMLLEGCIGGNHRNHGQLYVLGWRDGRLVDFAPEGNFWEDNVLTYHEPAGGGCEAMPRAITWDFTTIDDNPALEILQQQDYRDNWYCALHGTRVFQWDAAADSYRFDRHLWDYEDSAECALRQGQAAMWEGDYATAIRFYEQSRDHFAHYPFAPDVSDWDKRIIQIYEAYTEVRLALAYSLVGREDEASQLLASLTPLEDAPPATELVTRAKLAYGEDHNQFGLCAALYDTFADYFRKYADTYWGMTDNVPFNVSGLGSNPPPAYSDKAGCDAEGLLTTLLDGQHFRVDTAPDQQLAELHIPVGPVLHADMNGDGVDEWLVWFPVRALKPILFVSDGDYFQLSRPDVDYPDAYTQLALYTLPDDAGLALVYSYFDGETPIEERWQYAGGGMGGPSTQCIDRNGNPVDLAYFFGSVELWRLEGDTLQKLQAETLCETMTLDDLFPSGAGSRELHAWLEGESRNDEGFYEMRPAVFQWYNETQRYESAAPTESVPPEPESTGLQVRATWELARFFRDQEYTQILATLDQNQAYYAQEVEPTDQAAARYLRALTLEALDRPDEALAKYVALYESAPESAWGMLAALHLEPVNE